MITHLPTSELLKPSRSAGSQKKTMILRLWLLNFGFIKLTEWTPLFGWFLLLFLLAYIFLFYYPSVVYVVPFCSESYNTNQSYLLMKGLKPLHNLTKNSKLQVKSLYQDARYILLIYNNLQQQRQSICWAWAPVSKRENQSNTHPLSLFLATDMAHSQLQPGLLGV